MKKNRGRIIRTDAGVSEMAHGIDGWLNREKNMVTRLFHMDDGAYEVHARHRRSETARLLGLDMAVSIRAEPAGERAVLFTVYGGSWKDKLIAGGISLFVLWPLALCAGFGVCRQAVLLMQTREKLNSYSAY